MTPLEAKFAALLVECEKILEPVNIIAQKWVIISKTQQELQQLKDKKSSLTYSFGRIQEKIKTLKSYDIAKQAFERDNVFSEAKRAAGYWAKFEAVLQYLISRAGEIRKESVYIDHAEALWYLKSFRQLLTSSHLEYEATARIFGVNLRCKSLSLPDGVTLYRLNRQELNDRQTILQPYLSNGFEEQNLGYHSVELRVSVTVPVDVLKEGAFFNNKNDAYNVAGEIFSKILQAILVVSSGKARVGHIELKGGLEQIPFGQPVSKGIPPHTNIFLGTGDIAKIEIAYDLVSGGKKCDKTLSRALHRYILGRQRSDLIDKLVDYVIAWEAILLTQDGNPITQELSYRFALNGASLLSTIRKTNIPNEMYKKMRSAYSARSSIVHGGDDKDRDKALKKGNFKNLNELCNFLEESFRLIVFKLSLMKPKERPYRQASGWEALIWSKK